MTCRFQKVPVVFNKSLVDLENCTSFVKSTCDLLNSTCEIDLLKLLARHTDKALRVLFDSFKVYLKNRIVGTYKELCEIANCHVCNIVENA